MSVGAESRPPAPKPHARFPGHGRGCTYPLDHCNCNTVPFEDTEAYRRRRDADLEAMGSRRIVQVVELADIRNEKGHVVGHELRNERRRKVQAVKDKLNLSPRQLKKLRKRLTREAKERNSQTAETNIGPEPRP